MEVFYAVLITLGVVAPVALVAGGYLHYRFGKNVVAVAQALKDLPK